MGKQIEAVTVFEAYYCPNIPTDCCDYGIVSNAKGKEVCRVWDKEDAVQIADLLNGASTTPDSTVELYDSVDWLAQGYPSAAAEIEDMANVGRALMERIADVTKPGAQLAGWSPADCPTEIVTDLLNMLHEVKPSTDSTVEVGELVERLREALEPFARAAEHYRHHSEGWTMKLPRSDFAGRDDWAPTLRVRDLRRARAALGEKG